MIVLSGMSTEDQMKDNLSYMKEFVPFTEKEDNVIIRARAALKSIDSIPCTACNYCTPGCPMQIRIPVIFECMNRYKLYQDLAAAKDDYSWKPGNAKASACIKCGQCEGACPQHLPIMNLLEEIAATLE
jgi:predicted aldo/keto reductase-like oxidoreductase